MTNRPRSTAVTLEQRKLFGDRVYAIRFELRLTRQQFSERFGLPVGTVKAMEDGRYNPLPAMRLLVRIMEIDAQLVATAAEVDRKIGPCTAVRA